MSWFDDVIYKITMGILYGLRVLVASVLAALVVGAFLAAINFLLGSLFGTDTDAVVSEVAIEANHCVFTTSAPEQIVPFLERDDLACDTITIEIIPL